MKKALIITIVMLVALMQLAVAPPTVVVPTSTGQGIDPVLNCSIVTGNAASEIAQIDPDGDYLCYDKIGDGDEWDASDSGWTVDGINYTRSVTTNGNTITITAYLDDGELKSFDWDSTEELGVIMVKAGSGCYLIYTYDGAKGDTGLMAPDGKGVSHTTFGWACGDTQDIPEFPTIALPVVAILGLAFFMQRRKE